MNIRKKIYEYLEDKKEEFLKNSLTITRNNETILIYNYIDEIKYTSNWAGDLEISATYICYNCNIIIYKFEAEYDNQYTLSFYNIYGDINLKKDPSF